MALIPSFGDTHVAQFFFLNSSNPVDNAISKYWENILGGTGKSIAGVLLGSIAVLAIMYASYLYLTAGGDAGKVKKSKDTIMYVVLGIAMYGAAFGIINAIMSLAGFFANPIK